MAEQKSGVFRKKSQKKFFKYFSKIPDFYFWGSLRKLERQKSQSESEVKKMGNKKKSACPERGADEELIDTLIAISVVAKKLANKVRQSNERRETENG